MTTTEHHVRPGQAWEDCDPQYDATRLKRFLRVDAIDHAAVPVAVCTSWWAPSPAGRPETPLRKTRVRVSRLRPSAFRLVQDAPEVTE